MSNLWMDWKCEFQTTHLWRICRTIFWQYVMHPDLVHFLFFHPLFFSCPCWEIQRKSHSVNNWLERHKKHPKTSHIVLLPAHWLENSTKTMEKLQKICRQHYWIYIFCQSFCHQHLFKHFSHSCYCSHQLSPHSSNDGRGESGLNEHKALPLKSDSLQNSLQLFSVLHSMGASHLWSSSQRSLLKHSNMRSSGFTLSFAKMLNPYCHLAMQPKYEAGENCGLKYMRFRVFFLTGPTLKLLSTGPTKIALTGPTPKSSKCRRWQNLYPKSES